MALKPGPKPIAKSTGELDQRRRDTGRSYFNGSFCHWSL